MSNNLLFVFGAGAEKAVDFPISYDIQKFLKYLIGYNDRTGKIEKFLPLKERLRNAFQGIGIAIKEDSPEFRNFYYLLRILMDGDGERELHRAYHNLREARMKYRQHYIETLKNLFEYIPEEKLNDIDSSLVHHLERLEREYDWANFKALLTELYGENPDSFNLQDILSMLTLLKDKDISLPVQEYFEVSGKAKGDYRGSLHDYKINIDAFLNFYKLLLFKLFKVVYATRRDNIKDRAIKYKDFFKKLIDNGNVDFVSLNWNPFFMYILFEINAEYNRINRTTKGKVRYFDPGMKVVIKDFEDANSGVVYSYESSIGKFIEEQQQKGGLHFQVDDFKFVFKHGLFNLRICPACKTIFTYKTDTFRIDHIYHNSFLIDPLPIVERDLRMFKKIEDREVYKRPDLIRCPVCGTPTTFKDSLLEIQTIFKGDSPIEHLTHEFASLLSKAEHVIFIGYSFPEDDKNELLLLKAFRNALSRNMSAQKQKISVVLYDREYTGKIWLRPEEIKGNVKQHIEKTVDNFRKLFPNTSLRITLKGFPNILNVDDNITYFRV